MQKDRDSSEQLKDKCGQGVIRLINKGFRDRLWDERLQGRVSIATSFVITRRSLREEHSCAILNITVYREDCAPKDNTFLPISAPF